MYFVDKSVHYMKCFKDIWFGKILPFLFNHSKLNHASFTLQIFTQALLWQSDKCAAKSKLIPKLLEQAGVW